MIYIKFFVKLNGTCGTKKENPEFEEKPYAVSRENWFYRLRKGEFGLFKARM